MTMRVVVVLVVLGVSGAVVVGNGIALGTAPAETDPVEQWRFGQDGALMRLVPAESGKPGKDADSHLHSEAAMFMDAHEVTVEQFLRYCAESRRVMEKDMLEESPCLPAEVSWKDAAGYAAFYGKRLPTCAEYEWALRGGRGGCQYPWGDGAVPPPQWGNYAGEETRGVDGVPVYIDGFRDQHSGIAPVGSYAANAYRLYDISGNTWEWSSESDEGPRTGDVGDNIIISRPTSAGKRSRFVMGGSWRSSTEQLKCSIRASCSEECKAGFRCVQTPAK